MPQLRLNVATKDWVIVATERARRPEEFRLPDGDRAGHRPEYKEDCVFCPGNEEREGSVEVMRVEGAGAWQVRVLPNKYPALRPGERPSRDDHLLRRHMEGVGHHEVVVNSPRHNSTLAMMKPGEVLQVLKVWQARYRALAQLPETEHVIIFKNHGPRAGSSLEHPHSQVVSLPVVPGQVCRRVEEATRFYNDFGQCVFCRMLDYELQEDLRIVTAGRHFTAFIPYAAFSPFHLWLLPNRHICCFSQTREEELVDLAEVLQLTLARYYHGLNDPNYNLVLRTALPGYVGPAFFHYYLALVPRLAKAAGFELGTGMFINPSLPERDAAFLRQIKIPQSGDGSE